MVDKKSDNLWGFEGFKNSFEDGIKEIKECSGKVKSKINILERTGYIMAMMTDKFDLQYIEEEKFCRKDLFDKALEIRIFNESGEIKWFRSSIDKPLQKRKKLDSSGWTIFADSDNYWDERQYLDIDDTKCNSDIRGINKEEEQCGNTDSAKSFTEKYIVTATGGGRYPLPIKAIEGKKEWYKDLQIIVRNYLNYEKNTMQLFISDWRLVGFGYEEIKNKL